MPESQLSGLQQRAEVALLQIALVHAEPLRQLAHRGPLPEGADVEDELAERFRAAALSERPDAFPEDLGEFPVQIPFRRRRRFGAWSWWRGGL